MQRNRPLLTVAILLALMLALAGCDAFGPGNVQNLPPAQDQGALEESIEESGLEGKTGVAGQTAQEGDTTQEQIESNVETYELGSQEGLVAATWLIGRNVETMNEGDLGEIEDLLVDRSTGRVLYALVQTGGLLDIGEAVLPVPLAIFQVREQAELILPVQNQEAWGNFPDLDDTWTTALTPEEADQINAFWNEAGLPVEGAGDLANAQWVKLSTLLGANLAARDAAMGQIGDLLIDLPTQRIKYAVVASSGDDGRGGLLPYAALVPADDAGLALKPDFETALWTDSPELDSAGMEGSGLFDAAWDDAYEGYWAEHGFVFEQ